MVQMAKRVAGFGTTIFSEINALAAQHNAVNLGQGKPDFDGPNAILKAASAALMDGLHNQYAHGLGIPTLRKAIAEHERTFYGLELDPDHQVVITVGATEGVFAAILGLVDAGDEVIIFEPFYDSYVPNILMAGAIPRYVPLHPPTWSFNESDLRAAFSEKTRAIILNSPHNPSGKVFSLSELQLIANLCQEFDVIAITDEVYEHIIFDEVKHIPLITLPNMAERTVKISSLGKTFSVTGWKIGWAVGPTELITGVQRARQFITFSVAHPLQAGAVAALKMPLSYYDDLRQMYQSKRDQLVEMLNRAGLKASVPQGSYFVMADFSEIFGGDDVAFARWLIKEVGVACIPPSFFYSPEHRHIVAKQARFAFCKSDIVLEAAQSQLLKLQST
ncbi:MAG: aminotransferase [Phototrophicales bacterium]|nr:MAG: aminotransferase [Phototrophicales bacterium]